MREAVGIRSIRGGPEWATIQVYAALGDPLGYAQHEGRLCSLYRA